MEEFDDERFARGPRAMPSATPGPDADERATSRQEERVRAADGGTRLRVIGHGADGRAAVQQEAALLQALRTAGLGAAPTVLAQFEGGYEREDASPLRRGGGRRSAEEGAPPTGERVALARAREELEAMLDVLHARGWVLGAPRGEGLGVRADGGVVVLALDGLRRDDGVRSRQGDRLWIDSVLGDRERTLRRRVDTPGRLWEPEPAPASAAPPLPGGVPAAAADRAVPPAAPAVQEVPGVVTDLPALPEPRTRSRRRPQQSSAPSASPHRTDGTGRAGRRSRAVRDGRTGIRAAVSTVRGVLGEPRHRRTALLSGMAALVLGGLLTGGMWWSQGPDAILADPTPSAAATPNPVPDDGARMQEPPDRIADPWELAAELAGDRHAYVTGLSDIPVATPGSEAYAEDLAVREAYAALEVRGAGPIVHEAEVLEAPTEDGDAVLRALVSTPAHEIVHEDGTVQEVPATAPAEMTLALRWDGQQWRIQQVREPGDVGEGTD